MSGKSDQRNPGIPLDLDWVDAVQVNRSAVERRCSSLTKRRSIKKAWQAAWLLKAIRCMDLTTLSSDDTPDRVRRLCSKALRPLKQELTNDLGITSLNLTVGAVCVYHALVETAVKALKGSNIPVAAVSTGFPHGLSPLPRRIEEIRDSVSAGALEIDIVITRAHVFSGNWEALYQEIKSFREACGDSHLKTILGTGELGSLRNVAKASLVCMMAGADFIKTSTGKEPQNATLPVSLVMLRMIRDYHQKTGHRVGFKPAGGIRTAKQALEWQILVNEELGREWLEPELFRFGASGLLTDIERQLEHFVTGRYSAAYRQPMG
ncbi:MAG: deoxyribose-phosphate aldolase [SAR324 cluster bacterium]|nr:deoxyribose-phosphate aldolase [SAR324 cluster bacterium]